MFIAIQTRYLGPTNCRGARIQANTSQGHRCVIPYPHEANNLEGHRMAAEKLIEKYRWRHQNLVAGGTRDGYVWVAT